MTDFATALAIVGAYLAMVTIVPKIMSGLDPIDSYPVRFVYNVVQVRQPRVEIACALYQRTYIFTRVRQSGACTTVQLEMQRLAQD